MLFNIRWANTTIGTLEVFNKMLAKLLEKVRWQWIFISIFAKLGWQWMARGLVSWYIHYKIAQSFHVLKLDIDFVNVVSGTVLTISMLGKSFSRQHSDIFLSFPENVVLKNIILYDPDKKFAMVLSSWWYLCTLDSVVNYIDKLYVFWWELIEYLML